MGGDAAHGGQDESGADFADQRAASLRRMFPNRPPARLTNPTAGPGAPPHPTRPAAGPGPAGAAAGPAGAAGRSSAAHPVAPRPAAVPAVPAAARKPRRWGLVFAGILVAVIAASSVAAFRVVSASPSTPVGNPATEGFPIVAPPSFAASSPPPLAGLQSAIRANIPTSAAATPRRTPHRAARTAAPAPSKSRSATKGKPISAFSACSTAASVTFKATFADTFSWHHVYIDADGRVTTGYQGEETAGLGADYMIEDDLLYRSTGPAWGWTEVAGVSPLISRSAGTFRWQLPSEHGGTAVVFNGATDDTDISTRVVRVKAC